MILKYGNGFISRELFESTLKELNIVPPKGYWEIVSTNDGGSPITSLFEVIDIDDNEMLVHTLGRFLSFISTGYDNILELHKDPPEFFPEGLVAFAEDGGGNLICFDYREGKDNPNPPVVYWNHEADIGKDVSFIAKDFETFIGMLKSDDEL